MSEVPGALDHLVYATPDVAASVDALERLLGVRAAPGGRHPAWGTHNALIGLGPGAYLEVIGPDPDAPPPGVARPFGLDGLGAPRLATWAARDANLEQRVAAARKAGLDLGEVAARSRRRPDGTLLEWRLTDSLTDRMGGVIPFFIDWGETRHPSLDAPAGCEIVRLYAEHSDPERASMVARALGLGLRVAAGMAPALIATISTPRGPVELR